MKTICPNLECKQTYNIKPEMLGATARCKRCNTTFTLIEYIEPVKEITLIPSEESTTEEASDQYFYNSGDSDEVCPVCGHCPCIATQGGCCGESRGTDW